MSPERPAVLAGLEITTPARGGPRRGQGPGFLRALDTSGNVLQLLRARHGHGVCTALSSPRELLLSGFFFFFSGDKCHEVLLSQMASRVSQHGSDLPHFPFSSVKCRANGGWVGGPLSGKKEAGPRRALQTEGSRRERGSHIHMPRGSRALALE